MALHLGLQVARPALVWPAANSLATQPGPPSTDACKAPAARVIHSDNPRGAGRRGVTGCARRKSDDAPPRQLGLLGRLRRAGDALWGWLIGMATTSCGYSIRRFPRWPPGMPCLAQRNVRAKAAALTAACNLSRTAAVAAGQPV